MINYVTHPVQLSPSQRKPTILASRHNYSFNDVSKFRKIIIRDSGSNTFNYMMRLVNTADIKTCQNKSLAGGQNRTRR